MDEMSFIEKLMVFGLTRQEASIYLCLYRNGILTGYEAAKLTGISRSNVYNALAGLAEKGAGGKKNLPFGIRGQAFRDGKRYCSVAAAQD